MSKGFLFELVRSKWLLEPAIARQLLPLATTFATGGTTRAEQYVIDKSEKERPEAGAYFRAINEKGNKTWSDWADPDEKLIGIIEVRGVLSKYESSATVGVHDQILFFLEEANKDKRTQAIIMLIDSPGGSATAVERVAKAIRNSRVPVIAFIEDMAGSGGIWLATAAHHVYANDAKAQVGSIGALVSWLDMKGKYEKDGATFHEYYATQSDLKNGDFRKAEEGDPSEVQAQIDELAADFIAAVKEHRRGKVQEDHPTLFRGAMFNASEAVSFGLLDGIATLETVIEKARSLNKQTITHEF